MGNRPSRPPRADSRAGIRAGIRRRAGRVALAVTLGAVPLVGALGPAGPTPVAAATASAAPWMWRDTTVRGTKISYAVAVPSDFVKGQSRNVLLAFPPGGQTRDLVDIGMLRYWAAEGTRRGWVVISPAAPGDRLFFDRSAPLVAPFVASATAAIGVKPLTMAVGGISNGGLSAFRAALDHPDRYVALVTLPGAPPSAADPSRIARLARMRVGLWVGGDDTTWRQQSEKVYNLLAGLSSIRADVQLHVLEGQGHILDGVAPAAVWDVITGPTRR